MRNEDEFMNHECEKMKFHGNKNFRAEKLLNSLGNNFVKKCK